MFNLFYSNKDEGKNDEIVYVDKDTHIKGNIHTNKLIVEGTITGTVWADDVIMKKGSIIRGEVFTSSLLLDDDIKCDCEFHIDKDFATKGDPANFIQDKPGEKRIAAAV